MTGTGFYRVGSTFLGDVARTATISLNWYDASKTFLSSSTGVSGTDSTNNPLTIQEVAQAPSSAAFAVPHINVAAVPEGEFHYVLDTFVKPY